MPKREKTIEALYRLHYDDLLRRACILLHDEEDARDAVSDVMARLMVVDILPESERLVAYVRSSVRFECLNRLKRMKLQESMRAQRRSYSSDLPKNTARRKAASMRTIP